ncbi:MAG: hypothetical protein ACYTF6_03700 [Planctomycetota bacterium]|jgi:squalene-hopene/tetraprenyl-beta-curcumene cyclase
MSGKRIGILLSLAVIAAGAVAAVSLLTGRADREEIKLLLPRPETDAIDEAHVATAQKLMNGGVRFLLAKRDGQGGWGAGRFRPAVTALVVKALVQHPSFDAKHPIVTKAVNVLMSYRHEDGGFYDQGVANYTTSIAVMALVALGDPQYKSVIDDAVKYLKGIQIRVGSKDLDGRVVTKDDPRRGGLSYGEEGRPDMCNAEMTVEAWHEGGVAVDDEAMQEVLIFLTRTQDRKESNPLAWAQEGENTGGFIYAPALKGDLTMGESKAGYAGLEGKGPRTYGSMSYAGFKSLLHAGVARDDRRVQAALDWIRTYWRLDSNPNMPHAKSLQGLYYYYHVFAKALRAWGEPVITDARQRKHNWRHELIDALAERVRDDGSWVNEASRWEEKDPVLVTTYVVLALQEAFMK